MEKQLNECQNQIDHNANEIYKLKKENEILNANINNEDIKAENLRNDHSHLNRQLDLQESELSGISSSISTLESDFSRLERDISYLERRKREREEEERRQREEEERRRNQGY